MEKVSKRKLYDVLIVLFVFLLSVSIPFPLFIKDETWLYAIDISLRIAFLIFAFIYMRYNKMYLPENGKLTKSFLLLIPFLLICFSNYFVCLANKSPVKEISLMSLSKDILLCILVAIAEELVFRVLLYDAFKDYFSPFIAMLLSSLIFGLIHLFNITSVEMIIPCLIQALYSFGLGMILCLMYETTHNFLVIVSFHFLFNFLNDKLVTSLFDYPINLSYYLINLIIALLAIGYFVFLIFLFKRKDSIKKA